MVTNHFFKKIHVPQKDTIHFCILTVTLKIISIRFEQIVQTQIILLLWEQYDLGLQCLPSHLDLLDTLLHCKTNVPFFRNIMVFFFDVPTLKILKVDSLILRL